MADFTSCQFLLCCEGMAHICSRSLLLAWKGISKLLWQMLALSPTSLARCWNLSRAKTQTYMGEYKTAKTVAHWFRVAKMATLILAGADDDVVITVPIHTASQKIDYSWATLARGKKRKGELTVLINGPLVNDDTPSTPFDTMSSMIHQLVSTLFVRLRVLVVAVRVF